MKYRPDGRKYARITRKSAEIIGLLRQSGKYTFEDVASIIKEQKAQEFYLKHLDKYISPSRVRDYLRFLVKLGFLAETAGEFTLELKQNPSSDQHKIQLLADRARIFLAEQLSIQPSELIDRMQKIITSSLKKGQLPTLDVAATSFGLSGNRETEQFRWAIYLLLDEPNAIITLKYSPVLYKK